MVSELRPWPRTALQSPVNPTCAALRTADAFLLLFWWGLLQNLPDFRLHLFSLLKRVFMAGLIILWCALNSRL